MNKKEVPKQQPAVELPRPEPVATASGTTFCKNGVEIKLAGTSDPQLAMTMNSPSVLSLGRRCKHEGYHFVWEGWKDPQFFDPNGVEIMLDLISDVPYLPPHFVTMWKPRPGMPATTNADGEGHPSAAESAEDDKTAPLGAASTSGEEQSSAPAAAPLRRCLLQPRTHQELRAARAKRHAKFQLTII